MMNSCHADVRAQQRGIPPLIVDWLERFGEEVYDHRGCVVLHFSKRSVRCLERNVGREPVRRMSEYLQCYAVLTTDGKVITVGKRFKHIRH